MEKIMHSKGLQLLAKRIPNSFIAVSKYFENLSKSKTMDEEPSEDAFYRDSILSKLNPTFLWFLEGWESAVHFEIRDRVLIEPGLHPNTEYLISTVMKTSQDPKDIYGIIVENGRLMSILNSDSYPFKMIRSQLTEIHETAQTSLSVLQKLKSISVESKYQYYDFVDDAYIFNVKNHGTQYTYSQEYSPERIEVFVGPGQFDDSNLIKMELIDELIKLVQLNCPNISKIYFGDTNG